MATTATHVEKIKAIQADLAALAARLNDLQAGEAAEVDEPVDVGDASAAPPAGEEVKKEGDEGGAAAAASQAVDPDAHKEDEEDETDPKKLEEEEEEEVKKMEASEDGAVAKEGCSERKLSRGEADSLASKLLSRFPRAQTASDVIGEIFALESLARASEERERAQRKLSREAAKQANFDLAVARGIVNPLDKSRAEEFRTMPLRSQRVALERGAKLFPTSVKSDRKALERAPAATVPAVAETPSSPGGSFFESLPPELKEMMERSQSIIGAKK